MAIATLCGACGQSPCAPGAERKVVLVPERPTSNSDAAALLDSVGTAVQKAGVDARHCLTLVHVPVELEGEGPRLGLARYQGPKPVAILAVSANVAKAALARFDDVPVIFFMHVDPVAYGVANSYRRPGGRSTGVTSFSELGMKRLAILQEAFAHTRRVGVVVEWSSIAAPEMTRLQRAAKAELGVEVVFFPQRLWREFEESLQTATARSVDSWLVLRGVLAFDDPRRLVSAVQRTGRPALYGARYLVRAGGLASYEPVTGTFVTSWASMLDLVLSGVPVGDIPIELPTVFAFSGNVQAAEAGQLPTPWLVRADQWLETQR